MIGRHAVSTLLDKGWTVTAVGRGPRPAVLDSRARYRAVDLLAPGVAREMFRDGSPDVLVHLAWYTTHGLFWEAAENLNWVGASLNLVQSYAEAGGKRIVAAGTCVEYDPPAEGPCSASATPLAPLHIYAVAKDAFRRVMAAYCAKNDLSYAWGRIFLVTGEGESPGRFVPSIVRALSSGEKAKCSSGRQIRDIMDTRDCGAAFAALAASDRCGAINICSGIPQRLGDVARCIGKMMGRPDLIELGVLADRPGEPPNLWGETSGFADIGFRAQYTLDDALKHALACWRPEGTNR